MSKKKKPAPVPVPEAPPAPTVVSAKNEASSARLAAEQARRRLTQASLVATHAALDLAEQQARVVAAESKKSEAAKLAEETKIEALEALKRHLVLAAAVSPDVPPDISPPG